MKTDQMDMATFRAHFCWKCVLGPHTDNHQLAGRDPWLPSENGLWKGSDAFKRQWIEQDTEEWDV